MDNNDFEEAEKLAIKEEIEGVRNTRPHVLILGAGASRAAMPNGDKNGKRVPLLYEVAQELGLVNLFPDDLKELAASNFELAYSKLFETGSPGDLNAIDSKIHEYFLTFELPDEPNLYDVINLSLRDKDAVFTFNWDPFLMQSRVRLAKLGVTRSFPKLFFLHGNVSVGFCEKDRVSGILGNTCGTCNSELKPSKLLYPVGDKDYSSDPFIKDAWEAAQYYLEECSMLSIFGYSAPPSDEAAIELLKSGWGNVEDRSMEQTEIINRPGADLDELRETWDPFIHTHHYDIWDDFYASFIAKHPRRSIEAHNSEKMDAKFIANNTVPKDVSKLEEFVKWFEPLFEAEKLRKPVITDEEEVSWSEVESYGKDHGFGFLNEHKGLEGWVKCSVPVNDLRNMHGDFGREDDSFISLKKGQKLSEQARGLRRMIERGEFPRSGIIRGEWKDKPRIIVQRTSSNGQLYVTDGVTRTFHSCYHGIPRIDAYMITLDQERDVL